MKSSSDKSPDNAQVPTHNNVLCLKCALKLEKKVRTRYPSLLSGMRKMQVYKAVQAAPMVTSGRQQTIYRIFKRHSAPALFAICNNFDVNEFICFLRYFYNFVITS